MLPATHSLPMSAFIIMWLEKSLFHRKATFWQNKQNLQNYCKLQQNLKQILLDCLSQEKKKTS